MKDDATDIKVNVSLMPGGFYWASLEHIPSGHLASSRGDTPEEASAKARKVLRVRIQAGPGPRTS